jgi:hypothetical protein
MLAEQRAPTSGVLSKMVRTLPHGPSYRARPRLYLRQFDRKQLIVCGLVLVVERGQVFVRALATPGTVFAVSHRCVPRLWAEERILRDDLGAARRGEGRGEAMKILEVQPVSQ